jgi:hypothetical protein
MLKTIYKQNTDIINMKNILSIFFVFASLTLSAQIINEGGVSIISGGATTLSSTVKAIPQDSAKWSNQPLQIFEAANVGESKRMRPKTMFEMYGKKALMCNPAGVTAEYATEFLIFEDDYTLVPLKRSGGVENGYTLDTLPQTDWQGPRCMGMAIMYDSLENDWLIAILGRYESGVTTLDTATFGLRYIGLATTTDFETFDFFETNPIITANTPGISTYAPSGCDATYPRAMWYDEDESKYKMLISATAGEAEGGGGGSGSNILVAESSVRDSGWTVTGVAISNESLPAYFEDPVVGMNGFIEINGTYWAAVRSEETGEPGTIKVGLAYASEKEGPYTILDDYIINAGMATNFDLSNGIASAILDYSQGQWRLISDARTETEAGILIFSSLAPATKLVTEYEYGFFDIGVEGSTTAGSVTLTNDQAYYIRERNKVTVWFKFDVDALGGSPAGDLRITGLPYRALDADTAPATFAGNISQIAGVQLSTNYNQLGIQVQEGTTYMVLKELLLSTASAASTTQQTVSISNIDTSFFITASVTYIADF